MDVWDAYGRSLAVDFATDAVEGVLAVLSRFKGQPYSDDFEGVCEEDGDTACY